MGGGRKNHLGKGTALTVPGAKNTGIETPEKSDLLLITINLYEQVGEK